MVTTVYGRENCVAEMLDISFSIEHESNCQISFLSTLVSSDNSKRIINVYRKPTHTQRYLFPSNHDKNRKVLLRHLYIEPQIYLTPKMEETKKSNESRSHWNLMGTL